MTKRNQTKETTSAPSYVLPQWELQRKHRLALDQRVRSVRRGLLAGGLIGTVAFSALAGYETKVASGSTTTSPTATEAPSTQLGWSNFFASQSSSVIKSLNALAAPSPTSTATVTSAQGAMPNSEATTAAVAIQATQTAQANSAATETAEANVSETQTAQANIAATETAAAIPTDTPVPTEAPAVQPQQHSRTQSSN